jgi:hypothetical protein
MWSPRRLVRNVEAICALAWLLALVGFEALLGLNRRPPVTVWPRKPDALAERESFLRSSPNFHKGSRPDVP